VTYGDTLRSEHPALWSLSFEGQFKVSPAVTADGAIRLGKFTVTDAPPTAQRDAFTRVHSCTVAQALAPTPSTPPCAAPDDVGFPARVKVKELTGELLIGNFPG